MSKCGECTRCCTLMAVESINKPAGDACVHLCDKACSIYQFRPSSCREFKCLWLHLADNEKLALPKAMRPDRCGVMFVPANGVLLAAHCTSMEAFDAPLVKKHVTRFLSKGIDVVRIVGEKRTLMSWMPENN